MQMIDAAASQNLKALWAIGYDVALTNPDSNATKAALAKLDFIVVQDLFLNELARGFGHVFLPACSSFEKDGTFMNSERRVQRVRRVIEPMGHSKPDWEIICEVAKTLQRSAGFRPGASEDTERAGSETARVKTGHSEFMDDDRTPPSRTHLISTGLQPGDLAAKAIPAASAASSRPVKAVETALTPADGNTGLKPGANENPDSPAGYESLPRPASRGDGCSGFDFRSPEEIWNEVRAVWKAGAGIRYARLEHAGLQWPCPDEAHPGTTILHTQSFPHGPRAALQPVEFRPTAETPTAEFPLLLTTGRTLYQFNAGTMTRRTPNATLRGSDTLDIAPADAERLALRDGDRVRVCSRHGEAVMPVRLDPRVKPGELFATFHAAEIFLNQLTSPHRDRVVMTPEYKVVAVRVEKSG
jgi:predicted molibdopterin-dependent oxidoreductase YjgC